jgi:hypothetical protein
MEVVMAHAQQQGAVFPAGLPLIPTLHDIKGLLTQEASAPRPGTSRRAPPRSIRDAQEEGEFTYFEGKGRDMRNGADEATDVYNAVGFFLYTQCSSNPTGVWPTVLCASLGVVVIHTEIDTQLFVVVKQKVCHCKSYPKKC